MARYSITIPTVATGTTANSYTTLVGLKFANTTGHKAVLRRCVIGGGNVAAQDLQVSFRFDRTDNAGDGTSTSVATTGIMARDSGSVASNVSAIGKTYTAEPTTAAGDAGFGGVFNTRAGVVLSWDANEGPAWGPNQTLVLQGCMGTGSTAATMTVSLEWDE